MLCGLQWSLCLWRLSRGPQVLQAWAGLRGSSAEREVCDGQIQWPPAQPRHLSRLHQLQGPPLPGHGAPPSQHQTGETPRDSPLSGIAADMETLIICLSKQIQRLGCWVLTTLTRVYFTFIKVSIFSILTSFHFKVCQRIKSNTEIFNETFPLHFLDIH